VLIKVLAKLSWITIITFEPYLKKEESKLYGKHLKILICSVRLFAKNRFSDTIAEIAILRSKADLIVR
jgi:hypothetical protein